VFEIGRVFLRDASAAEGPLQVAGLRQPMRVAAAACGPALDEQWGETARGVDFFDLKADVEALCWPRRPRFAAAEHRAFHPGRSARIWLDDEPAGWLGELHPAWQRKYELPPAVVLFELEAERLGEIGLPQPAPPPRFPAVVRDIALVVAAEIPAQALLDAAETEKIPLVRQVSVFDRYVGANLPAGMKSLAFRVVMQHTERTLTDAEADAARDALVALWGRKFGGRLRI